MMPLLTMEGLDGSGKSTQVQLLLQFLTRKGIPYVYTREPGGTPIAEQIRTTLLSRRNLDMSLMTEALLFAAARAENVEKVIRPALSEGKLVVCDRYVDSSLAYQGYAGGLPVEVIRSINEAATGGLWPDMTLLFDLPVEEARSRQIASRVGDRIEARELDFHQKVRDGYRQLAAQEPHRFVIINAARPAEAVHADVITAVLRLLSRKGGFADREMATEAQVR